MFRRGDIPKRLMPGTIALGAFTFTMDALPGSPQIQNMIPTTFFGTDAWAAPMARHDRRASSSCGRARLARVGAAAPRRRPGKATAAGTSTSRNGAASVGGRTVPGRPAARWSSGSPTWRHELIPRLVRRRDHDGAAGARAAADHAALVRRRDLGRAGRAAGGIAHGRCCSRSGRVMRRFADGSKAAVGGALLARSTRRRSTASAT